MRRATPASQAAAPHARLGGRNESVERGLHVRPRSEGWWSVAQKACPVDDTGPKEAILPR